MSTATAAPDRIAPGDTVTFTAPSGRRRHGRVLVVDWYPQVHDHARYRITVAVAGTTLTITPADLL